MHAPATLELLWIIRTAAPNRESGWARLCWTLHSFSYIDSSASSRVWRTISDSRVSSIRVIRSSSRIRMLRV